MIVARVCVCVFVRRPGACGKQAAQSSSRQSLGGSLDHALGGCQLQGRYCWRRFDAGRVLQKPRKLTPFTVIVLGSCVELEAVCSWKLPRQLFVACSFLRLRKLVKAKSTLGPAVTTIVSQCTQIVKRGGGGKCYQWLPQIQPALMTACRVHQSGTKRTTHIRHNIA